jgi:hypothetical protein
MARIIHAVRITRSDHGVWRVVVPQIYEYQKA